MHGSVLLMEIIWVLFCVLLSDIPLCHDVYGQHAASGEVQVS